MATTAMKTKMTVMAPRIAHPWRESPTIRPNTKHSAAGISNIDDHLHEVGQRSGIFVRMGGIRIEKSAAVGAQHLDGLLRGDRAHREGLRVRREGFGDGVALCVLQRLSGGVQLGILVGQTLQRVHVFIGVEVLDDALRHEEDREDTDSGSRI